MDNKNYMFLYFDIDQSKCALDFDEVYSIFKAVQKAMPDKILVMLPKNMSHSDWLTKEEMIEQLERLIKEIKETDSGKG